MSEPVRLPSQQTGTAPKTTDSTMTWHKPSIGDVWLAYVEFADHPGYDHEKARVLAYAARTRAFLHPCELPGGVGGEENDVVGDVGAVGREGDDVDVGELALEGLDVLVQERRLRTLER